jgi:hypothetical protein
MKPHEAQGESVSPAVFSMRLIRFEFARETQ